MTTPFSERPAGLRRAGKGGTALRSAVSSNAAAFASDLVPVLADIRADGFTSLRAIASEAWGVGNVRVCLIATVHLQGFTSATRAGQL
jgi:hypothetical protein